MKTFSAPILMMSHQQELLNLDSFYSFFKKQYNAYCRNVARSNPILSQTKATDDTQVTRKSKVDLGQVLPPSGKYLSQELHNTIISKPYNELKVDYKYCEVPVKLALYFLPRQCTEREREFIIHVMNFIIYYCKQVYKDTWRPLKNLEVKLVLSPYKKQLEKNTTLLTEYNVNSGLTWKYYGTNSASVLVYRKEEIIKVLIHELLHAFDMDSKFIPPYQEQVLKDMLNIHNDKPFNVNESFTDAYACLLNICIASTLGSKMGFWESIAREAAHVSYQGVRIARLLGFRTNNCRLDMVGVPKESYYERTHVMAYYVLKGQLFLNIEAFAAYLIKNHYRLQDSVAFIELLKESIEEKSLKDSKKLLLMLQKANEKQNKVNKLRMKLKNEELCNFASTKIRVSRSLCMSSIDVLDVYRKS
jgi:hypothetical protein